MFYIASGFRNISSKTTIYACNNIRMQKNKNIKKHFKSVIISCTLNKTFAKSSQFEEKGEILPSGGIFL